MSLLVILWKVTNISSKYTKDQKEIIGIVTNIKKENEKTILNIKGKENIIGYYYGEVELSLGDKVKLEGELKELNNNTIFNLFSYKKYMLSKNTYFNMNINNIKLIKQNNNILYKIKNHLINRINKISGNNYLYTFILGDNSFIDNNVLESYRINGISHLFSVSGMHVSLLSSIILYILNRLKKSGINYLIVILFLLFFLFLTNFTPSIIRSVLLFIFLFINKKLNLKLSTLRIILIILFLNLIVNPYYIYNVGFKFSYIISIYLIAFNKIINRYKNYVKKIFITSLISFLASIPILINNYFNVNFMTIINNIVFVPLVSIIIFPFSLIVLFIPKLDFLYNIMINMLEKVSIFFTNFKIEIIFCKTNLIIIIIYYFLITLILYKFLSKKYKYIFLIIVMLFIHANINYVKNNTYVTFIDVGQGDSALILLPHNKANILVDTGGKYNYDTSKDIINYLKSMGIKKLDYLILTHGDFDHMGSSINLINNFKVDRVIFNNGKFNDLELELIKHLENKKIPYYKEIEELDINNNKLYFLNNEIYDNENDNSIVLYTKINNHNLLLMGDASIEVEKNLIEKYNLENIDILKVGHHGSKTNTSKEFINYIEPEYSIISVGKNNRYGHPNNEVLDILNESNVYRTDQEGSVMFKFKNDKLEVSKCSP